MKPLFEIWKRYINEALDNAKVQKYLNDFGTAGWRLVSIHESPWTGSDIQVTAYFENEYWDDEDEDDDE